MLVLMALIESFVARRGLDFLDGDDWAYRESRRAAAREGPRSDILCFGDSLTKCDLLPRAVAERSGRRVFNLGVSGSQATASYFLFRRALDAGARPEAVLVDFFPPLLRVDPRRDLFRWSSLLGPAEAIALAAMADDPGLCASVVFGRLLPSLRGRASIRANVLAALGGRFEGRRFDNAVLRRNWSRNRGAHLMPARETVARLTETEVERYRQGFYPAFRCSTPNARAIGRFLRLAEERRIPVFWVLPPIAPAMQARLDTSGFDAAHRAFVQSWQERFPGLTVIDARHAVHDPAAYYDPNHLAGAGALGYSLALGDLLRAALSPALRTPIGVGAGVHPSARSPALRRWVVLSPCRPRPLPEGVEDYDASRLALRTRAGSSRLRP